MRQEFYRRLAEAFAFLESRVRGGRIGWYGVSSNTAVAPPDDPEATSLSRMLESAREAGGADHHFRVLEVPLNLFESGAIRQGTAGPDGGRSLLEVAAEVGIAVLTNRPLNAFAGQALIRLADVPIGGDAVGASPEEALQRVAELEEEYRAQIGSRLRAGKDAPPPTEWFRWGDQLHALADRIQGLDHWQQVEEQMITPAVAQLVTMLDQSLAGPFAEAWGAWRDRYLPALDDLLEIFRLRAARQSQAQSNRVAAAVNPHLPLARRSESLSRKALWVLASTPGVTAVLVGMRHPDYVADALEILKWPPLGDARKLYDSIREIRLP